MGGVFKAGGGPAGIDGGGDVFFAVVEKEDFMRGQSQFPGGEIVDFLFRFSAAMLTGKNGNVKSTIRLLVKELEGGKLSVGQQSNFIALAAERIG